MDGAYLWDSLARYDDDTHLSSGLAANSHHDWVINWVGTITLSAISTFYHVSTSRRQWIDTDSRQKYRCLMAISAGIAVIWPYFRDGFSGLKNGNHAYMTSASLSSVFHPIRSRLGNPVGIVLGVLLAINLIWYRRMDHQRQEAMARYQAMIDNNERHQVKPPSHCKRGLCYGSAFFDGSTDGVYLSGCVIGILALCHVSVLTCGAPIIVAMVLISLWTLASIISKSFIEHEKQKKHQRLIAQLNGEEVGKKTSSALICTVTQYVRTVFCAIKNGRSFVVMVVALGVQKPLNFVGKKIGVLIGGLVLGCCYAAMMLSIKLSNQRARNKTNAVRRPPISSGISLHSSGVACYLGNKK